MFSIFVCDSRFDEKKTNFSLPALLYLHFFEMFEIIVSLKIHWLTLPALFDILAIGSCHGFQKLFSWDVHPWTCTWHSSDHGLSEQLSSNMKRPGSLMSRFLCELHQFERKKLSVAFAMKLSVQSSKHKSSNLFFLQERFASSKLFSG